MTVPIDLARNEDTLEQQTPKPRVKAPLGAPRCCVGVPPGGDACGATATCTIVWPDDMTTPACADCAQRMNQMARSHRTGVNIIPLG